MTTGYLCLGRGKPQSYEDMYQKAGGEQAMLVLESRIRLESDTCPRLLSEKVQHSMAFSKALYTGL